MQNPGAERRRPYPTELIKYAIKIDQNLTLCDFGNVIHCLTGVVSYTGILVSEAGKHRRNYPRKIPWEVLTGSSQRLDDMNLWRGMGTKTADKHLLVLKVTQQRRMNSKQDLSP